MKSRQICSSGPLASIAQFSICLQLAEGRSRILCQRTAFHIVEIQQLNDATMGLGLQPFQDKERRGPVESRVIGASHCRVEEASHQQIAGFGQTFVSSLAFFTCMGLAVVLRHAATPSRSTSRAKRLSRASNLSNSAWVSMTG